MCGLVGIVAADGDLTVGDLDSVLEALHHRGPDGRGAWVSRCGRAALGHTRLAVIDPVGGVQPMHGGHLHVVVNGEFYGFEAIRQELVARGCTFTTGSDSEIALHLWQRHGPRSLAELRGEFAFALWDDGRGELVAARDRFGVKPLFYARHRGRILLASEVGALFAAGVPRQWDRGALAEHLVLCHPPHGSLFAGIHQLPPGCWLRTDGRTVHIERFWDLDYPRETDLLPRNGRDRHVAAVRDAVVDAVEVRLRADVPVAHHLSGGLDSGAIAAIAAGHGRVHTFGVGFDDPDFDESREAAATARAIGADHTEVRVGVEQTSRLMEEVIVRGQMIPENGHGVARFLHSAAVRAAGYRVVLAGEGGDEMFAGYPQSIRDLAATGAADDVADLRRRLSLSDAGRPLLRLVERLGFLPGFVLDRFLGVGAPVQDLLTGEFLAEVREADPCRDLLADPHVAAQSAERSVFHRSSYLFAKTWLANYLLAAERLDMAHGLEVRLPFLDHRLHEVVRHTPLDWYTGGPDSKPLLRSALRDDLPAVLRRGTKRPFLAPPASSNDAFLLRVQGLVDGGALDERSFFDPASVRAFLTRVRALPPARRAGHERVIQIVAGVAVLTARSSIHS